MTQRLMISLVLLALPSAAARADSSWKKLPLVVLPVEEEGAARGKGLGKQLAEHLEGQIDTAAVRVLTGKSQLRMGGRKELDWGKIRKLDRQSLQHISKQVGLLLIGNLQQQHGLYTLRLRVAWVSDGTLRDRLVCYAASSDQLMQRATRLLEQMKLREPSGKETQMLDDKTRSLIDAQIPRQEQIVEKSRKLLADGLVSRVRYQKEQNVLLTLRYALGKVDARTYFGRLLPYAAQRLESKRRLRAQGAVTATAVQQAELVYLDVRQAAGKLGPDDQGRRKAIVADIRKYLGKLYATKFICQLEYQTRLEALSGSRAHH